MPERRVVLREPRATDERQVAAAAAASRGIKMERISCTVALVRATAYMCLPHKKSVHARAAIEWHR